MAWTAPRNWIAGETVTAAMMNTHIRDNELELRAGGIAIASQGTGDFIYAGSATQLARVSGQLAFPATQNPSAGANTLDDYEEGSWTPVLGGSGGTSGQSYTNQVGRYVKIGLLVEAYFHFTLSNKGTITGNVEIQGLPFTIENVSSGFMPLVIGFFQNLAGNTYTLGGYGQPNTTAALLTKQDGLDATMDVAGTSFIANNTEMVGSITYRATG